MDFDGGFFPGLPDPALGRSQRNYSYDPLGSLTSRSTQWPEETGTEADNITRYTIFGEFSPRPPAWPETGLLGNIVQMFKPQHFSWPDWFAPMQSNDWNDLRGEGVAVGPFAPHLPMQPVPVWKLYEPGSGFILPATFLGQPLAPAVRPVGA